MTPFAPNRTRAAAESANHGARRPLLRLRRSGLVVILVGCVFLVVSCSALLNRRPHATFSVSREQGVVPLTVTFDASESHDSDGKVTAYIWSFGDGSGGAGTRITHQYTEPGTYLVRLVVSDDAGSSGSAEREVHVRAAIHYAVVIGIAAYYYAPCLWYVDDDAYGVRDALLSSRDWNSENITLLLDAQATTWNLVATLDDLATADENDLLFLFFSGHGGRVPDDQTAEEQDGFDEVLYLYDRTYLSDDALTQLLDDVPMRRVVVAIDSCFSGGHLGAPTDGVPTADWGADVLADLRRLHGVRPLDLDSSGKEIVALTASREDEYSRETESLEHGIFTYALLEGMRGAADAAGDNDGFISAEECYRYAAPRVADLVATIGEQQRPQMLDLCEGELEFLRVPDSP